MAKILLPTISSGYATTTTLNAAFDQIEDEFQSRVLYRNNVNDEPNHMLNNLDMNNYDLLNVGQLDLDTLTVNGVDYIAAMNTIYNNYLSVTQQVTVSTASPSGGSDGDIWFKVSS